MAIRLQDLVQNTHRASPPRILLTGTEKAGKTTFFSGGTVRFPAGTTTLEGAPSPIFIPTEDGLRGVSVDSFPLADNYQQVIEYMTILAQEEHSYKTVVVDSADWLERLLHQAVIDSCPDGRKIMETAHGGYGKAYGVAMGYWRHILNGLDYLNREKGMIVGVICHSQIVKFDDPNSEPYDRYELKLHQPKRGTGARDLLMEWADVIAFAEAPMVVNQKDTTDGKKVVRGQKIRGQLNKMHLQGNAAYVAGNRYGLPETIPLNWADFAHEMETATGAPILQPENNQQTTTETQEK